MNEAYDVARDDAEHERVTDCSPDDWRDWLNAICGASDPWHDLDSEGIPAQGARS